MSFLSRLLRRGKDDRPVRQPAPVPHLPVPKPAPARPHRPAPKPGPEPEPSLAPAPRQEGETVSALVTKRPAPEPEVTSLSPPMDEQRVRAILESVLDKLGTAHHRPFSRG